MIRTLDVSQYFRRLVIFAMFILMTVIACAQNFDAKPAFADATRRLNELRPEEWKQGTVDVVRAALALRCQADIVPAIAVWERETIGHLPDLMPVFEGVLGLLQENEVQHVELFRRLPSDQQVLDECASWCDRAGFPAVGEYFRHFHVTRLVSVGGSPGMQKWLPVWQRMSVPAREMLFPIVMLSFSGSPMGRAYSRPGQLQHEAWQAYLRDPKEALPSMELAIRIMAQSPPEQRREFFSLQNMQRIEQAAGRDAATVFARKVPEFLPDDPNALATAASFLMQHAVDDGIRAFSEAENRLSPVDARRVRMALYLALRRYSQSKRTPELFDAEVTRRRQLSVQKPEDHIAQMGWADALCFKAKYQPDERATLAHQATASYRTIIEQSADRRIRLAALCGLCEADPVYALQVARPVVEEINQGAEAIAVGECLQNALRDGLPILRKRVDGEAEAPSLPAVAREGADLLIHLMPVDRRAPEIFLARATSSLILAGDQAAAVKFFSEQLANQPRLRRREPDNVATILAHLDVSERPHASAMETGLHFLDHLATAPTTAEPSVQRELCQIWGEFLFRTLLLFRGTIPVEGAQRPSTITQEERTQSIARMKDILESRLQGPQRAMLAPIIRERIDGQLPIIEKHDPVLAAALQQIRKLAIGTK